MLFRRSEGPLLAQHLSLFEGEGRNGKIPASFRVGTLRQVRIGSKSMIRRTLSEISRAGRFSGFAVFPRVS